MGLINVKFESGITFHHGFRGEYSAPSQEKTGKILIIIGSSFIDETDF